MSYRSFKRVLGESNLERKCFFLFGACLLLLITGSFLWYGTLTDKLVLEKNRSAGRHLVDAAMLKLHWAYWRTEVEDKEFLAEMMAGMETLDYDYSFISLEATNDPEVKLLDKWERKHLPALKVEFEELREEIENAAKDDVDPSGDTDTDASLVRNDAASGSADATDAVKGPQLPFRDRHVTNLREYHFYQPVYWKKNSCDIVSCHSRLRDTGALSAAELALSDDLGERPFCVVKVEIPYQSTQKQIAVNRANLFATAIITVFLAMVALYVVVRYVIVKPLKHLRDVSDEVGRGEYSRRAEIHTNDEFEDLARSFNRMLRHLVETQDEMRHVNADLDAKVDELAQLNMQLYEMNRLKGDFLANMSHELRTPLNSIIGFSDVLQSIDSLDEKQKRYASNIGKSGRVLLDMINDTLDLAKMESGKMEIRLSEFAIDAVVRAQCDFVRSLAEEKNIDLEVATAPGLPPMCQDQGKVQQIVTNLLSNAIKYTPEGGRIVVSARRDGSENLELRVTDTGVGITEDDREVIFEKFRQGTSQMNGDNLTRQYSGTGLGLSIVKELCKLLKGEVDFESELGKGSSFTVSLPWKLAAPPRAATLTIPRQEIVASGQRELYASGPQASQATGSSGAVSENQFGVGNNSLANGSRTVPFSSGE